MTKNLKSCSWAVQSGKGGSWEVAKSAQPDHSIRASFARQWDRHRVAPSHTASCVVCFAAHVLRDALKFCSGRHITATMAGRPAPTKVCGCGLHHLEFKCLLTVQMASIFAAMNVRLTAALPICCAPLPLTASDLVVIAGYIFNQLITLPAQLLNLCRWLIACRCSSTDRHLSLLPVVQARTGQP